MSDSTELVTTISIIDNASKVLESIEAAANRTAAIFDKLLGIERSLSKISNPLGEVSESMNRIADGADEAEDAVSRLKGALDDVDATSKRLTLGDVFGKIVSNGANIFGLVQMASGALSGFQSAMAAVDANTSMISRLGQVARNEGIAMEDKEAWQGRAEEIRKMLSAQAIDLGLDTTEYTNNAITFASNPAFKNIEEASRFSELMSKQFFASGVGGQAQMSVINQLTQGLSKGRLQGEDLMSILSNAPDVGGLLEEAYARLNHIDLSEVTGHVRELAGEGKLTADVIKDAFFGAADRIEANFEEMPNTFEDMITKFKNTVFESFQPVMQLLSRIGNSESFKSLLNSVSNIIGKVMDAVDAVSPILEKVMDAAAEVGKVAEFFTDYLHFFVSTPLSFIKSKTTKDSPVAVDQRMKIYEGIKKQIDLLRDNSDAIQALADAQKTFNERTKDLFDPKKDLDERQSEWLKDYQHSHVEETISQILEGLGGKSSFTNANVEYMREQLYADIPQGSIFSMEQYKETEEQYKKASEEVEKFAAKLRIAEQNLAGARGYSERYAYTPAVDYIRGKLEDMTKQRAAIKGEMDLYNRRMNEWYSQIAGNTKQTARNTRRVSINRDDLLFMKNIATAQIINNYNNNTNTANFNQSFGSGSAATVKRAAQDGWSKAQRGSSSSMAG